MVVCIIQPYLFFFSFTKKFPNDCIKESIPSTFVTIGLLGTFLGIAYGLINFNTDPGAIKDSSAELLDGLKVAFV
ncbi:hypothetical protein [Polaribacter dokdonensis]|uniref:Uncharacterized protein n=1 Tax=Polaribacter dokdonensis DSW-5 TaxID=1300348 RepID=A0A0N0UNM2_9FLAO|nr:hypothetical protein [Polaribacter dokdonensis]KOY51940.1 hypothetical protein I602_1500 [Polaribacter dokdonensis DSW-5]